MSKIFVAGASGRIGGAVLDALNGVQMDVVAGVHSEERAEAFRKGGQEARVVDCTDMASMTTGMEGCDKLFLVLPLIEGMTRMGHLAVEAAKEAGITYIVRSSGYAASSDAHWMLGREHGMVDQFVEDSGIDFTVLRPNSLMQNFSTALAPMIQSGNIMLPEEDARVSYLDARDLGACAATLFQDAGEHRNKMYALTGPEGLSLGEVATTLTEVAGHPVTYTPIEEEQYVEGCVQAGVPEWTVRMLVSLSRVVKLGMAGNVTKAVEYITGTPSRTFGDFTREHADIWKQA